MKVKRMENENGKRIGLRKVIICVVMAIVVAIAGLVMYSENVHKIGFIENIKQAIEEVINPNSEVATQADATIGVDVTNIVNDDYVEHEHIWYEEYDETNHWRKCSICNMVEGLETHMLTTTWTLGYESCQPGNTYIRSCKCGYGENGELPCTWTGEWGNVGVGNYNIHTRGCAVCKKNIDGKSYIDKVNGDVLVPNTEDDLFEFGVNSRATRCVLADGSNRPCDSSESCAECGGPRYKASGHCWAASGKDKIIRCHRCGAERWNI